MHIRQAILRRGFSVLDIFRLVPRVLIYKYHTKDMYYGCFFHMFHGNPDWNLYPSALGCQHPIVHESFLPRRKKNLSHTLSQYSFRPGCHISFGHSRPTRINHVCPHKLFSKRTNYGCHSICFMEFFVKLIK